MTVQSLESAGKPGFNRKDTCQNINNITKSPVCFISSPSDY